MPFLQLPLDIVKSIFSYSYQLKDILTLRIVCRDFRNLIDNNIQLLETNSTLYHLDVRILTILKRIKVIPKNYILRINKLGQIRLIVNHSFLAEVEVVIDTYLSLSKCALLFLSEVDDRYRSGKEKYSLSFRKDKEYFCIYDGNLETNNYEISEYLDFYLSKFPLYSYTGAYFLKLRGKLSNIQSVTSICLKFHHNMDLFLLPQVKEYNIVFSSFNLHVYTEYYQLIQRFINSLTGSVNRHVITFYPIYPIFIDIIRSIFPNLRKLCLIIDNLNLPYVNLEYNKTLQLYEEITFICCINSSNDTYHACKEELQTDYSGKFKFIEF